MKYLTILGLVLFAVNSLLHLFWKKHGNLTKAFIMPTIVLSAFLINGKLSWMIIVSAVFSWLGDLLLEKEGIRWFTAGGLAFIVSHLLYGLFFFSRIGFADVNRYIVVPVCAVYCLISVSTIWNIRKTSPEKTTGLLLLYLFANAFMNTTSLAHMLTDRSPASIAIYVGAVLFFISDNCLFYECFHKKRPNLFIPVMSTYIAGEFLIVAGSALLK